MNEKVTPIGNRILIRPSASDEMSAGGILIPETARPRSNRGEVIAVGPKVKDVKPGDHVVFSKYSGAPHRFNGEEMYLVLEDAVLAVEGN